MAFGPGLVIEMARLAYVPLTDRAVREEAFMDKAEIFDRVEFA